MKKLLIISMLLMFGFCTYSEARVQYDSTGRNIIVNDTIRGRRQAAEAQKEQQRKIQAAAAGKIDYEQIFKSTEPQGLKSNYYQDRIKK